MSHPESSPSELRPHSDMLQADLKGSIEKSSSGIAPRTRPVRVGNVVIGENPFVVIAGPCSIESAEQLDTTARAVRDAGASLLRGGVWKLRTNANSFQGLGPEALNIAQQVTQQSGLGFVSEITDARQIELLDPVVSMYQVGARNMHNYALLKELGRTKKPILLKRNFAAFIDEWLRAAEYILAGGNEQVILCERGIRTFETATRFTFDINAVAWIKARSPFPILVDPSHAVGQRALVPALCYAAAAAGADGLIVEVHPHPESALSDGAQSLNIPEFQAMTQKLSKVLAALDRPLFRLPI